MVDGHNIYFANILEYWFGGGTIIDDPEIRIFDLYDESPWRDTDLGITPSMNYAEEFCTFYRPYYIKENSPDLEITLLAGTLNTTLKEKTWQK